MLRDNIWSDGEWEVTYIGLQWIDVYQSTEQYQVRDFDATGLFVNLGQCELYTKRSRTGDAQVRAETSLRTTGCPNRPR